MFSVWISLLLALIFQTGIADPSTQNIVHPIDIDGRQFIDTVTGEPFLIKGIDYQPGGSSGYLGRADPLSDPNTCARDVFLFQKLGINAIRVYTVNPDLDHNECMSMLAASGIYLILDVNSPKPGESLNRYEPWTSYTKQYLHHIFKVVEAFSGYNNTLGFFAGNEVVNDDLSANSSPIFLKAVIRDIKMYIENNTPRHIPVGYSAADDLRYRISLAKYLECGDYYLSADFYGVNSYQWCGSQSFQSSGYDALLADYEDYSLPLFLSEYGCNAVTPRLFQEIHSVYSDMTPAFSGGLVYEYTQEPNSYGLVEMDHKGNAHMLKDFDTLQEQFSKLQIDLKPKPPVKRPEQCAPEYLNLNTPEKIPASFATMMITNGVRDVPRGKFVNITTCKAKYQIYDSHDTVVKNKTLDIPRDWFDTLPANQGNNNRGYKRERFKHRDFDANGQLPLKAEQQHVHVPEKSEAQDHRLFWSALGSLIPIAVASYVFLWF